MLLIDHNIIVVSVQQLRGQGHPPHGHHLVTPAAPEGGQISVQLILTSCSRHLRRVREESRRQQQSAARASSVTVARTASTREASSPTSTLTSTGPDSGDTGELVIGDGQSNI